MDLIKYKNILINILSALGLNFFSKVLSAKTYHFVKKLFFKLIIISNSTVLLHY